jgi:clan AA aspartic protease (TIGR02281 family)
MRRVLGFLGGVFVGQWLMFGAAASPADLYGRATTAWEHRDYVEALRLWSQAVRLEPSNAELHTLRGRALARLGLRASAADAFHTALALEPQSAAGREAMAGLASLQPAADEDEIVVPLESGLGVWIVPAAVNGQRGRFLLDTGSSVIVVGPTLAAAAGLAAAPGRATIELQTLGGRTRGPSAVLASLQVGDAVLRNVPVVLHDPGPGVDGILGNTFLSRYQVVVDGDRRQLSLRPPGRLPSGAAASVVGPHPIAAAR